MRKPEQGKGKAIDREERTGGFLPAKIRISRAAKEIGCSAGQVYRFIEDGDLEATIISRRDSKYRGYSVHTRGPKGLIAFIASRNTIARIERLERSIM